MDRHAVIKRTTRETDIDLTLRLDGKGRASVNTGVGFLDHMLTLWAVHGFFDLELSAQGDLEVDAHHTVEDTGICMGQAVAQALGDFSGIRRYGSARIPMEESLARVDLDLCRRPFLVFNADFRTQKVGTFDTELIEEFLRAMAVNSGMTLHAAVLYGSNSHHMAEAVFKALGRAMDQATEVDPGISGVLSSKGQL
ncbi:MAG TPA: imidazoleglycerol-phosphate dehydratase HisB [Thermodesulfobacteriaceae bacterium]|nr:imidazoleglycerol-phosphate dehydratase HisB [Thermodesulfobacteriaceae bacterium]